MVRRIGGVDVLMLLVGACLQTPSCLLCFDVSINLFLLAHGGGVTDGNGGGAFLIYWVVVGLGDVELVFLTVPRFYLFFKRLLLWLIILVSILCGIPLTSSVVVFVLPP